jgi:hypothetical protein
MEVPQKIKNITTVSNNATSEYISEGNEISMFKGHLFSCVHCSTIHSSQDGINMLTNR